MFYLRFCTGILCVAIIATACRSDSTCNDLEAIPHTPTNYTIVPPKGLPQMEIPANNPMTVEGVRLGRHLFYDPILSADGTISCASCHKIEKAFTDGKAVSKGINGLVGRRSSMSLINVGYTWVRDHPNNFMWDGRFATLEEQAIQPIFDPIEMANTPEKVVQDLRNHPEYPTMFREAFGVTCRDNITIEMVGKAIAQFERTLNSTDSKFDRDRWVPLEYMTTQELRGMELFMGDEIGSVTSKDAECAHCHSISPKQTLFGNNEFSNNGIDTPTTWYDFIDLGLGGISNQFNQNGQFRHVSLRNIALTAPYMHDGRFETLEEVMEHYVHGIKHDDLKVDARLRNSQSLSTLTPNEVEDIIAFLHALTDTSYIHQHPEWHSPF